MLKSASNVFVLFSGELNIIKLSFISFLNNSNANFDFFFIFFLPQDSIKYIPAICLDSFTVSKLVSACSPVFPGCLATVFTLLARLERHFCYALIWLKNNANSKFKHQITSQTFIINLLTHLW